MTAQPTGGRDEAGFSLIELMITTFIMGIALLMIFTSFDVFSRRTAQTQERALMLSETRQAVETITRDLRAANPIVAIDPSLDVGAYDTSVSFSVYCSSAGVGNCGTDNLRPVTYRVVNNQLEQVLGTTTKVLLAPRGKPVSPTTSRQGAIVNTVAQPIFKYYKVDGTLLDTDDADGNAAPSSQFRDCAQYVEIHLVVVGEPGKPTSTINLQTRASIRNFNQVSACT
jgi:prepilin-type N-terminal cleavage/methylation domain-containing protein